MALFDWRFDTRSPRTGAEPVPPTLIDMLADAASRFPQMTAVRLCHHGGAPEDLSYEALHLGALAVAARLREGGVAIDDRVLLVLPTSRAFIESFFGILARGAIPVPLSPPHSLKSAGLDAHLDVLAAVAGDCTAAACVTTSRVQLVIRAALEARAGVKRYFSFEPDGAPRAANDGQTFAPVPVDARAAALLQYTSGSTSRPKGVELSHASLLANCAAIASQVCTPETVGLSWLPLYHDMGLIGTLLTSLYYRNPLVLMPPQAFIKDPSLWLRGISDYGVTCTVAPNFAFGYCLKNLTANDDQLQGVRLDSLRIALNGAEPIDPQLVERFHAEFRALGLRESVVRPVYGLAESTVAVTFSDPGPPVVDEIDADAVEEEGRATPARAGARARRVISVGRAIPTQEVRVVDERDVEMADRSVGEIVVRGPSVMTGYWNAPEATADALRGGWLHTGDLGYLADGRLYITGRRKDLIIRNGRNYHPNDVEHRIAHIEGVRKGAVVAFSIEGEGDTRVVLVAESAVSQANARATIEREIRERFQSTFLFGPDDIRLVEPGSIPRTTSGKLRRLECRRLYIEDRLGVSAKGGYGRLLKAVAGGAWASARQYLKLD